MDSKACEERSSFLEEVLAERDSLMEAVVKLKLELAQATLAGLVQREPKADHQSRARDKVPSQTSSSVMVPSTTTNR